jgi:hypothetical protein
MNKEFVMRGKTASDGTEVLNFSGYKPGYAYRLVEFQLWPSTAIGTTNQELAATVTAAKTYEDPANPNFNNEGLIGVAMKTITKGENSSVDAFVATNEASVVNDTFLITQNLILAVVDTYEGSPADVNWQCRFVAEKMNGPEEAVANYKQFTISDE